MATTIKTNNFKEKLWSILKPFNSKNLNLMISGGSLLAHLDDSRYESIDTSKWVIFFADERCNKDYLNYNDSVPFLNRLKSTIYPIITPITVEDGIREEYESILKEIDSIDICLLGVGDNGHICSLWPDTDSLESQRLVESVTVDCPFSPERITVTLRFINQFVKDLYFVIPPHNNEPKKIKEPHLSIKDRIKIDYTIILPE